MQPCPVPLGQSSGWDCVCGQVGTGPRGWLTLWGQSQRAHPESPLLTIVTHGSFQRWKGPVTVYLQPSSEHDGVSR